MLSWNQIDVVEARARFARQALARRQSFGALCRLFGISRKTGYKWLARFEAQGLSGLPDRSRAPHRRVRQCAPRWKKRVLELRRQFPHWGAKKLRAALRRAQRRAVVPSVRTITRWVAGAGLVTPRRRRARRGPAQPWPPLTGARVPNEVWTFDFKGWFRTGDGQRVDPLTARDLHSRLVLGVAVLPNQESAGARRFCQGLFARFGLPKIIRVDNGSPFAGTGALGLSQLSVWWLRLGIKVEFTRRARPGDNAGHEQFHRVLKAETAHPPAPSARQQQKRIDAWVEHYNHERPHEALGQRVPARCYRPSPRPLPATLAEVRYPSTWTRRRVRRPGTIKWQGRERFIGQAFAGQWVGLQVLEAGVWKVRFARLEIGHLHAKDPGAMRSAYLTHRA